MTIQSDDMVSAKYFHVDNGGHTFKVDKHGNLEITNGHFGYSQVTLFLTSQVAGEENSFLRELATFLLKCDALVDDKRQEDNRRAARNERMSKG